MLACVPVTLELPMPVGGASAEVSALTAVEKPDRTRLGIAERERPKYVSPDARGRMKALPSLVPLPAAFHSVLVLVGSHVAAAT